MSELGVTQGIPKLTEFGVAGAEEVPSPVSFVETITVKEGVECDVYILDNDPSRDLAVVTVLKDHKTPLQRVLSGVKTTELFAKGEGILVITSAEGEVIVYEFGPGKESQAIEVRIGETMQWSASGDSDLVFYEICEPPYEDGRYENLNE